MILRALRGLLVRPTLEVDAPHAPVALSPGRSPERVIAKSTGVLRVGAIRRFVAGELDELFFVDIKPGAGPPEVRFRGHGVALPLTAVAAPAPAAPLVATIAPPSSPSFVVACPDLRPAVPRFVVSLPSSSASPEEPA
jgi:hypothetical protein